MSAERITEYLHGLLRELLKLPQETEWVEFKKDRTKPELIGEYISALSNSAALMGKQCGYMVWGIEDKTHNIIGTSFRPSSTRHKQQALESWLLQKSAPKLHFVFYEFEFEKLPVVILEIQAANHTPVAFDKTEYIRVGSYKKKLHEHQEKERELWRVFDSTPLVDTNRFLDSPPRSRNEARASFLRRIGICEERGIERVVHQTEFYQLPAPVFEQLDQHTRAILFSHREFTDMSKEDRIHACYLHCCLKDVNREHMNNSSLRERFGIEAKNSAMVSRIIKETSGAKLIKLYDPEAGNKAKKYMPWWV